MYPFVLEVARRGDEGDSGLSEAGGVRLQLQIILNKFYRKSLQYTVIHGIIESNRSIVVSTSAAMTCLWQRARPYSSARGA